jgi:hypothetical protein
MEKAIETSIEATKYAHDNGLEVVFFPIDFSRAELKWALDLIEKVGKDGHMDALALLLPGHARAARRPPAARLRLQPRARSVNSTPSSLPSCQTTRHSCCSLTPSPESDSVKLGGIGMSEYSLAPPSEMSVTMQLRGSGLISQ